jgi:hypothetical protein
MKNLQVPTNRKTLFLRNLEIILNWKGILDPDDIELFRLHSCPSILELVKMYVEDFQDDSIENMSERYKYDAMLIRRYAEQDRVR